MSDVFLIAFVAHTTTRLRRAANEGRLMLVKGGGCLKVLGRARRCNVFVNHRDKPYSVRYL